MESDEKVRRMVGNYIAHLAAQALLTHQRPLRTVELTSAIGDGAAISPRLVRHELRQREHFVFSRRRWELRWRQAASSSPLEGIVEELMNLWGKPVSPQQVCEWIAPFREQSQETLEKAVHNLLHNRTRTFWQVDEGRYGVRGWLLEVCEDEEEVLATNFFETEEEVMELIRRAQALSLSREEPLPEFCEKLLDALGEPIAHKELCLLLWWLRRPETSPEEWLSELFAHPRLQVLSFGYWATPPIIERLLSLLLQVSQQVEESSRQEEEAIPISRLLRLRPSKERMVGLTEEELDDVVEWMKQKGAPVELTQAVTEVLELTPKDPDYVPSVHALVDALQNDARFVPVGGYKWWLADAIPAYIKEIPPSLLPQPISPPPEQPGGEPFDVELEDAGLEADLSEWVRSLRYEEVGEDPPISTPRKKTASLIEVAIPHHHLQEGTLKVRRIDMPFFSASPPLQWLTVKDKEFGSFGVWVNLETGLMFGLKEWYEVRQLPAGGIVKLEKSEREDQVLISYRRRNDRYLHIPSKRLEELLHWRDTVQQVPVVTLMQILLPQHRGGMHFIQLWSEINVLRRTSKRVIASNLSAYPCFRKREGRGSIWLFDDQRAAEPIKEEKLKFLRSQALPATSGGAG